MADGWLEPRTRIPFVGILAITIIVAVVAVFIKTQMAPLFPEAEVTVQDTNTLTGMATSSDTFYGLREIDLKRKEYLRGTLQSKEATVFTVDVANRLLTINGEEIELQRSNDHYIARFEYQNLATMVDIDPAERTLIISKPGTSAVHTTLLLSDLVVYRGEFTYQGETHILEVTPGSGATIRSSQSYSIPLTQSGEKLRGTWVDGKQKRPVIIDLADKQATIEDVY